MSRKNRTAPGDPATEGATKEAKPRTSDVDYVRAAASAKSVAELAAAVGMTKQSAAARSARLRKAGVNLPKYSRAKKETDVAGLNALLA